MLRVRPFCFSLTTTYGFTPIASYSAACWYTTPSLMIFNHAANVTNVNPGKMCRGVSRSFGTGRAGANGLDGPERSKLVSGASPSRTPDAIQPAAHKIGRAHV